MESPLFQLLIAVGAGGITGLIAGYFGGRNIAKKAAEDRRLHVHQRQYDSEAEAYKLTWEKAARVVQHITFLQALNASTKALDSHEKHAKELKMIYLRSSMSLAAEIYRQMPFFDPSVEMALGGFLKSAYIDYDQYMALSEGGQIAKFEEHRKSANDALELARKAIRDRLQRMNTEINSLSHTSPSCTEIFPFFCLIWKFLTKHRYWRTVSVKHEETDGP